jgi:glycylpeptide N-tetradecanoyltransferase
MEPKDVAAVAKLLASHLAKFKVHPEFTKEEIEHFFLPRDNVIESWVIPASADEKDSDEITDFISFYSLPSTVLKNPNYSDVRVAYAYYVVSDKFTMDQVFEDALIIARDKGYDVFNSLNIMGYGQQFEANKFSQGDGFLHYYFYNWRVRGIGE